MDLRRLSDAEAVVLAANTMRMRGKARLFFAMTFVCLITGLTVFDGNPKAMEVTIIVVIIVGVVIRFSLKCPHCGCTLGTGSPDRMYYLTSDRCAKCGKEY